MAIHEYDEFDHPTGFQGLRVVRQINGKYKQKYFAFRVGGEYISLDVEIRLREEAQALDAKWAEEQRKHKRVVRRDTKPRSNTGVRGISACTIKDKKHRQGVIKVYQYKVFQASIMVDGKGMSKAFYVNKNGHEAAWKDACSWYRKKAGLRSYKHPCPDPSIFD